MIIETANKSAEIRFTTRSMIQFEERFKIKDSMQFWKRAAAGPSVKVLANALWQFSADIPSESDAYDFIDDYRSEGKSLYSLYEEMIQEVNGGGFFRSIYTPEELKEQMDSPPLDLEQIMDSAMANLAQKAVIGEV